MICDTSKWKVWAVWAARILVGLVFILSGWAKSVDPWGFVFKIEEYLGVWHLSGIPRDIVLVAAVGLSAIEFTIGTLLATGCLRRSTPICGLIFMAVMLPLTAYIAIANPVADCGCFGDFLIISNTATFIKNVVITGLLVIALIWNRAAKPLIAPSLQWIAITLSAVYSLALAMIGWNFQPVIDFRPYPVGAPIIAEADNSQAPTFIYEKDGQQQEFSLDALPDSTWTYVDRIEPDAATEGLAIFDGEDEVTDDVLDTSDDSMLAIIAIPEPGLDFLTRARFANDLADYISQRGGRTIGLIAASGETLENWIELARPNYDVYSASDTSLKQLVRGQTGFVLVENGIITIKCNFTTLPPDLLLSDHPLQQIAPIDDGKILLGLSVALALALALLGVVSTIHDKIKKSPKPVDSTNQPQN